VAEARAGGTGTLGQFDYSDERRKALISDIREASADERHLLINLSVSCEWPTNTDVYLSRDFDAAAPECLKELKLYNIEFLQQEPDVGGWRNPEEGN
jgi:hypothetical protein